MAPALQQHWNTTSTFRALPEAVVALFLAGVSEAALDRLRGQSATRQTLVCPHQDLLKLRKELLPSRLGAPVGLLLIRPEARLLHAQVGARARWSERKSHHAFEIEGRVVVRKIPSVGQRSVRLDGEDLAVQHAAPVAAQIEAVAHGWLEVVLHKPLLDQVWLRERAPDLFRRMRDLAFDNDGARFGRSFVHWSILLSRSSRSSNRRAQNPAIWPVQSISGAKALSCAL